MSVRKHTRKLCASRENLKKSGNGKGRKKRGPEGKSAKKNDVLRMSAFATNNVSWTNRESANGRRGTSVANEMSVNAIAIGETGIATAVGLEIVIAIMIVLPLTALIAVCRRDIATQKQIDLRHPRTLRRRRRRLPWMRRIWKQQR